MRLLAGSMLMVSAALLADCGGGGGGAGTVPHTSTVVNGQTATITSSRTVFITANGLGAFNTPVPQAIFAYDETGTGTDLPESMITNAGSFILSVATDGRGNVYGLWDTGPSSTPAEDNVAVIEYAARTLAPIKTIAGSNTELTTSLPSMAVAPDGTIFIDGPFGLPGCSPVAHLLVFSPTSRGNVPPTRDISGSATHLAYGVLAATADDTAYVAFDSSTNNPVILAYGPAANGNVAPSTAIQGSNAQLGTYVYALAASGSHVDASVQMNAGATSEIAEFSEGASGNVAPNKTISPPYPGLELAIDGLGNYVAYNTKGMINVFAPASSGAATPTNVFSPTISQFSGCATCTFLGQIAAY